MRRQRQMCMTSCDNYIEDNENQNENKDIDAINTRSIRFFLKLDPSMYQNIRVKS